MDLELIHYGQRIPQREKKGKQFLGIGTSPKTWGGFSETAPKTAVSSPSVKPHGVFFDRFNDPMNWTCSKLIGMLFLNVF